MKAQRYNFGLTGDDVAAINKLEGGLGTFLDQRLRLIAERLEGGQGHRGKLHKAANVILNSNALKGVADAVSDQDAVNLRTLLRFRRCDFLLDELDKCMDYEDDHESTSATGTVATLAECDHFFAVTIRPPESTQSIGVGGPIRTFEAWPFVLAFQCHVTKVTHEVSADAGGTDHSRDHAIGLYDDAGAIVIDTGTVNQFPKRVISTSVTPVTLEPGFYYLGFTTGGLGYRCLNGAYSAAFAFYCQSGTDRQGTGGIQATNTVPATLPSLTTDLQAIPVVMFEDV